jgi:hypothetical protein
MWAAWSPLVAAPPLTFLALAYAARPRGAAVAPLRLSVVRAALGTGAFAVLTIELLGALHALTGPAVALAWAAFLAAAAALACRRWRHDQAGSASDEGAHRPSAAVAAKDRAGSARNDGAQRPSAAVATRDRAGGARNDGAHRPGAAVATNGTAWHVAAELRVFWRTAGLGERLMVAALAVLVGAELLVALLAEPNNFDSQTYHLPKIEHWVAQQDLDFWPTAIHRQITYPPGAEYLLLHLRLLTGGDTFYNLLQWGAGVACLLIASRVAAQLGGRRRAQLITAFVVGTTPMVTLQATSTQTDLVVATWTACAATLALDGLRRRAGVDSVLALGAATGLTAVTKSSGLFGVAPLLMLWGIAQLRLAVTGLGSRRSWVARTVAASVVILAVALLFVGPFIARITGDFGHPLGPPRLRESIPMQRHDPSSILINGLRIAHTALDTPVAPVRHATAAAIEGLADLLGVDAQDRATTFGRTTFPVVAWYPDEDRVSFPIAAAVCLVGGVLALARPARLAQANAGVLRAYAVALGAAFVLYAALMKWQPWGNRLLVFMLVLASPLAGLWLDALFRNSAAPGRRSIAAAVAALVLATSALAGVLAVSYGFPRRLVGAGSLLTTDDWDTRFLRRPQWAAEFEWAAREVRAAGARRIGLVQQNDNWEYPWWLLLRDGGPYGDRDAEIVALQSVLPKRPPADPRTVEAIVCTGDRATCARLVPPDWRLEFRGYVGYAIPPRPR